MIFKKGDRKNGSRITILLAFALLCLSTVGYAENGVKRELIEEDKLGGILFEKKAEERLSRDIASYLGNHRFILRVDAEIFNAKEEQIQPPGIGMQQLVKPVIPEPVQQPAPQPKQAEPEEDYAEEPEERLPGLPFPTLREFEENSRRGRGELLNEVRVRPRKQKVVEPPPPPPPVMVQTPPPPVPEVSKETKVIKKIFVTFMVDRNIKWEQEEFVKNLVFKKLDLNVMRGDGFETVKIDFPAEKTTQAGSSNNSDLYVIVLLGILLLLMLATIFGIFFRNWSKSRRQKRLKEEEDKRVADLKARDTDEIDKKRSDIDLRRKKGDFKKQKERLLQDIVNLGVGQPDLANSRLKEELEGEDGLNRVAMLFRGIGFSLATSLFKGLSRQQVAELEDFIIENPEVEEEEIVEQMERFHGGTIRQIMLKDRKEDKMKPFSFLNDLDNSQVTYLVKEEEIKVKALILSQLTPGRMAGVLQNLPIEEQAAIAYELSNFDSIPLDAFRPVAQRIAKRAIDVPSLETITADGLGILVKVMDRMEIATQTSLLDYLNSENPETFHKIKKVFLTFNDLAQVPKRVLKDSIRDLERDVIAKALVHTDKETQDAILGSLNEEAAGIVRDEYKLVSKEAPIAEVDAAKIAVVERVRGYLKSGMFSMEDLEKKSDAEAEEEAEVVSDPTTIKF